jgi:glutathione reductase (NADPH)
LCPRAGEGNFSNVAEHDFDLFIIGAGSGGVRAARVAAGFGARVAVAEERYLGGTCVNAGCIPKKLFVYASHYAEDFEDAHGYGWLSQRPAFDWKRLVTNKDREITRLNGVYAKLLDDAGVTRIEGRATVIDRHRVEIGGRTISAQYLLIATGGRPFMPTCEGGELGITSDEVFHLEELPKRIVIVGGGYIATEFSCIFHGLGSKVTQLYRGPLFLRGFDNDVRTTLAEDMRKKGIDVRFDSHIDRLSRGEHLRAELGDGSAIDCDAVLFAVGRVPNTRGLGLEEIGVELAGNGAIIVDVFSRSSVESIYAIGDVTDRIALTPVAIAEGTAVARSLFGGAPTQPDHENVPTCMFSQPAVGAVGLTEAQARERFPHVDIYRSRFRALKHTLTGRQEFTMMKLCVDADSDRVVGIHVVGADAGEIVQGFAVALKMGLTKVQLDATIGIHPTAAEELVTMRTKVMG